MGSIVVQGNAGTTSNLQTYVAYHDYGYEYPDGLDLKPGSTLHNSLIAKLMQKGQASRDYIKSRFPSWNLLDRHMTGFVPRTEAESIVKAKDSRKPLSVVLPVSYVGRETILTSLHAAYGVNPFPVVGLSPDDTVKAVLLEQVLKTSLIRSKFELYLNTFLADGLTYGIGVMAPYWHVDTAFKTELEEAGEYDMFGNWQTSGYTPVRKEKVRWEGNRFKNIDPYLWLPDPICPAHDIQSAEGMGWLERDNRMSLLAMEQQDDSFFNCKYLEAIPGVSSLMGNEDLRNERHSMETYPTNTNATNSPVDVMYWYQTLIPKEWKLGDSDYPEKWLFAVAGDAVIIKAQPLDLNHNMYPISVVAPDFDGRSACPTARLEIIYGLQEFADWCYSVHIANIRKTVNNTFLANPFDIDMKSMKKVMSEAGGVVLLRRQAWTKDLKNSLMQIPQADVTRGHVQDAFAVTQFIERVLASPSYAQGMQDANAPERRTKAEFQTTAAGGVRRLSRMASLCYSMGLYDLGYMCVSHIQQFMSTNTWLSITGDLQQRLQLEYQYTPNLQQGMMQIGPGDIDADFDIAPFNSALPEEADPQALFMLYQQALQNPLLSQRFDLVRMYKGIARRFGERNIDDYEIKFSAMPDQQLMNMAADNQMIPAQEL